MAAVADKFDLYQQSVQTPDHEVEFFEQAFREAYKRKPYLLREDFCGTFAVCCEWVKSSPKRKAVGVDLCSETLDWGRAHNLSELKPAQQKRVQLLEQDVRAGNTEPRGYLGSPEFLLLDFQDAARTARLLSDRSRTPRSTRHHGDGHDGWR